MTVCSGKACEIKHNCERFIQYQSCDVTSISCVGTAMCIAITNRETLYYRFIPKGQKTDEHVEATNSNKFES